jgi:hypothetical protein
MAKLEDLTALPARPNFLARLTRAPFGSIALILGRATGKIAPACDMSFAGREKANLSQWEVGAGWVNRDFGQRRLFGQNRSHLGRKYQPRIWPIIRLIWS